MTLMLRYAAKSDVGMVRSANEDSGFAGRTLLAVADGMGGHAAGELASSTAIATLAELDSEDLGTSDLLTSLDDAILTSAERIGHYIEVDPSRAGMGTTLTAIMWQAGRIAVIHVGDSRAYLFRDGELSQITHDHTYVQSLLDAGRITAEEARRHPKRNLLLRAIDGNAVPEGETSVREAQAGELVDLALEGGAPDNVTAVLADVVEADDEEVAREAELSLPVVVGAAGERRNREALPGLQFPDDVFPGVEDPTGVVRAGPEHAGALAAGGVARDGEAAPGDSVPAREPATGAPDQATTGGTEGSDVGDGAAQGDTRPGFVRRHVGLLVVLAAVSVGMLIGLFGFLWWLSSQWYVGVQDGYVTINQGVPQSIGTVPLSRTVTRTALPADSLPLYDQGQLAATIDATTEEEAERIVADLEAKSAACAVDPAPLGCPTSVDPRTAPPASPGPTSSATPGSLQFLLPSATPVPAP